MATTIQISEELQKELNKRKLSERETYEEVIWDIIEDTMELSDEAKKLLDQAVKDVEDGRVYTLSEVERELDV